MTIPLTYCFAANINTVVKELRSEMLCHLPVQVK